MMTRRHLTSAASGIAALAATDMLALTPPTSVPLPRPRMEGGMSLMSTLRQRRSTRAYSDRALDPQVLSDLLWAAFGINRSSGDRTAPYWRHVMVLDLYVAMAGGTWRYEPRAHALTKHLDRDLRAQTGVAVDGSPTANEALTAALDLARAHDGRVRLVHVVDELAWVTGFELSGEFFAQIRASGERVLAESAAVAKAAGASRSFGSHLRRCS